MRRAAKRVLKYSIVVAGIMFFSYAVDIENIHKKLRSEVDNKLDEIYVDLSNALDHENRLMQEIDLLENKISDTLDNPSKKNTVARENLPDLKILVIACDRVTVNQCLDSLLEARKLSAVDFEIIIFKKLCKIFWKS